MTLTLVAPPAEQPLSLAEACAHLRVAEGDDDATVSALIAAATQYLDGAAGVLGRCLCTQTWMWALDHLPVSGGLRLPLVPVAAVTAVTVRDGEGVLQALPAEDWTLTGPMLYPAWGARWPRAYGEAGAQITFTAGYGDGAAVPAPLKQAILLLIGHWYDTRSAVNIGNIVTEIPFAVDALVAPYRVQSFG